MQSNQLLSLVHGTRSHTSQLLHVATNSEKETKMDAQRSDIGTSLAADPEHTQVSVIVKFDELALVDGSDTQLTLDGRDQRWALEQGTGHCLKGFGELRLATGQLVVQANDGNVLLACALLGLDQAGGTVNADNQAPRHLGIQSTAVAGLLDAIPRLQSANRSLHTVLRRW